MTTGRPATRPRPTTRSARATSPRTTRPARRPRPRPAATTTPARPRATSRARRAAPSPAAPAPSSSPLQRLRAPDVEALGVVDAQLAQRVERRLPLDPLRDRAQPHAPPDADHRLEQHAVLRPALDVADEVAGDLQEAERHVLEVVERGEAGAEVVERQPAAEPAQPLGEAPRLDDAGHGDVLGDLEHERVRRDVVARELRGHELAHPGVVERAA